MRKIDLTTAANFLRSRRFFFMLFLLGLIVGFFSLTERGKEIKERVEEKIEERKEPKLEELSSPSIPSLLPQGEAPTISVWGMDKATWKKFPKKVTVYKISSPETRLDPGSFWSKKFGLTDEGRKEGENKRLWLKKGSVFRFHYEENSFEYVHYPTESLEGKERLSLENLTEKAEGKVLDLGLFKSRESFSLAETKFLKKVGMERGTVSHFSQADEVVFFYNPAVLGFPLLARSGGSLYPTEMHLDLYGRPIELRHHLLDFELGEGKEYPIRNWSETLAALGRGEGRVVGIKGGGLDVPELKQATLSGASLAYLLPQSGEEFLQPIFVFKGGSGRGTVLEEALSVTIYLPAVAKKWFY